MTPEDEWHTLHSLMYSFRKQEEICCIIYDKLNIPEVSCLKYIA